MEDQELDGRLSEGIFGGGGNWFGGGGDNDRGLAGLEAILTWPLRVNRIR